MVNRNKHTIIPIFITEMHKKYNSYKTQIKRFINYAPNLDLYPEATNKFNEDNKL